MEIAQGTHRFVVAFPRLGIAVKIAKIRPLKALTSFISPFWHLNSCKKPRLINAFRQFYFETFKCSVYALATAKHHFFIGLADNWREFTFYRRTRNPFLQPTYFSLFGFVNFQRSNTPPCNENPGDIYMGLYYLTDCRVSDDGHHFDEPNNFTVESGRLKILDYGHPTTQKIIAAYGQKIWEEFDPSQCPKYKQEADK